MSRDGDAQILRDLLQRNDISISELSRASGISRQTLHRVLGAESPLTAELFGRVIQGIAKIGLRHAELARESCATVARACDADADSVIPIIGALRQASNLQAATAMALQGLDLVLQQLRGQGGPEDEDPE